MKMPSSQNAMQHKDDRSPIDIQWEVISTPDADQLIRQAVVLILRELEHGPIPEGFDNMTSSGHAESIPVENSNQPKPTRS